MPRLYMLLIGCSPKGRHIEQHDIFFGIGEHISEVLEQAIGFWPEAGNSFHLDGWRQVTTVDGYKISVVQKEKQAIDLSLYFLNLGGYKPGEFEEFHYRMLTVASSKNEAISTSKQTAFFKHTGFAGAPAHIDDKYGVGVDDVYIIENILPKDIDKRYNVFVEKHPDGELVKDELHLGYFKPSKVAVWALMDK